ncbi:Os06g0289050 [Oryza sativa Japonica Group]|uniref:Os06g0289050 protein n=1 Tax=Oryza sativa subsp. japonica TaxID=39947 RepID=A0A0P0WVS1_ORYSJ|nr:Os06g0289050 [Oryza sativa Japonica Group]
MDRPPSSLQVMDRPALSSPVTSPNISSDGSTSPEPVGDGSTSHKLAGDGSASHELASDRSISLEARPSLPATDPSPLSSSAMAPPSSPRLAVVVVEAATRASGGEALGPFFPL